MASMPLMNGMHVLVFSVLLLFVHILLQSGAASLEFGGDYNAGPRDEGLKPKGVFAGRAERALRNYLETYPALIALVVFHAMNGLIKFESLGFSIWFAARVLYIPLYLFGVPYLRSLAWLASIFGLGLVLFTSSIYKG